MPSFELLNKVEQFVRSGTYPADASKNAKKATRAASKKFLYRDGCLWRTYRGRMLRVVRSEEEVREIMIRYHDNNSHAGRVRAVKEIMMMYYWVGVTESVKEWIKACVVCQKQPPSKPPDPPVQFCLAYGCDASSYVYPELTFHRFPKEVERRRRWLAVAQRDEGSLRSRSNLCSRHFEPSCFILNEEGQMTLSLAAVPTIISTSMQEQEGLVTSDEDFLHSNSLEEILSTAAAAATSQSAETSDLAFDQSETQTQLQEHQYSLPPSDQDSTVVQTVKVYKKRQPIIESCFAAYNQIARYLSHRVLPMQSKITRGSLKRMAKRFDLIDGVLMFTRVSPPLRVPRSREEVNSILQQFHDNQGHYGQGICQKEIAKHFYWATMTRDLARWISSCNTCVNRTKRKLYRCSVQSCTNCCGPVERGLGLTFHKFPLHNTALLSHWLKAVGRSNWHPRLWSSVCSVHFTEDCFDRSGEKVTIRPDAVPTLLVHGDSGTSSNGQAPPAVGDEHAFFAKYDAVDLYLRRRTYPPGLSYVEKNTFRRFCKQFAIKDDELHMARGERVRLVLRNRQQVENALVDYHNELNHLDVTKCLRLLNERYFWKTMRSDVVKWIDNCSQCSQKKRPKPDGRTKPNPAETRSLQIHGDIDSGEDDDDFSHDEEDDVDVSIADDEESLLVTSSKNRAPVPPVTPQPRIPILLHLRAPVNVQPKSPIILQQKNANTRFVTKVWSLKTAAAPQSDVQTENSSETQSKNQTSVIQIHPEGKTQPQDGYKTRSSQGSARTHYVQLQVISEPNSESHDPPEPTADLNPPKTTGKKTEAGKNKGTKTQSKSQTSAQTQSSGGVQRGRKRKTDQDEGCPAEKTLSSGMEPVKTSSTKPWPVFTISTPAQPLKPPPEVDSPAPIRKPRKLQARMVIQHCSQAKVKIRPAVDGSDAQWAEIQEGMVVYVSFFLGATEDIIQEMANSLMTVKHFRKDTRHLVSILDLPGNVLFVPQDSLVGELMPKKRMQYKAGCELWWGSQLFSNLVSTCRELMAGSVKSAKAGVKVEQGIYGQKQEIVLNSMEPMTVLLEF
ncbi:uncharacterized protein LOC117806362 [Xyrichtys novacula]|uniref:D-aminoacyl-tRNA deacylase n=1 Tax=Xyrichtys novacula TaxID=13765 RepID=A0AAV1GR01_XYRNO|nr:uncharacterized protein LOC117806362 [Xyrichtys novacula]